MGACLSKPKGVAPADAGPSKESQKPVEKWSEEDVRQFLKSKGLSVSNYSHQLAGVDGPKLLTLTEQYLKKAGMDDAAVRTLVSEVDKLRGAAAKGAAGKGGASVAPAPSAPEAPAAAEAPQLAPPPVSKTASKLDADLPNLSPAPAKQASKQAFGAESPKGSDANKGVAKAPSKNLATQLSGTQSMKLPGAADEAGANGAHGLGGQGKGGAVEDRTAEIASLPELPSEPAVQGDAEFLERAKKLNALGLEKAAFKPVCNALIQLYHYITLASLRGVQRENAKKFIRVLSLAHDSLLEVQDASKSDTAAQIRDLVALLHETRAFVRELSGAELLSHLDSAEEDKEYFEDYASRIAQRLLALTPGGDTAEHAQKLISEIDSGALFAVDSKNLSALKSQVDSLGGADDVASDKAKFVQLAPLLEVSAADLEATFTAVKGVTASIENDEARDLWVRRFGAETEIVEADLFMAALVAHLAALEQPAGFKIQAGVAERLKTDAMAAERVKHAIDINRDGRVTIGEVRAVFKPSYMPVGDIVEAISSRSAPTNLFDLESYVPRPAVEAAVKSKIEGGARLIAVVGPAGSGKSCVAGAVGWELLSTGRYPSGVHWCDVKGRYTAVSVVLGISRVLSIGKEYVNDVDSLERVVKARLESGSLCLVLNNLDDALSSDGAATRRLLESLYANCEGVDIIVTTVSAPEVEGLVVVDAALPTPEESIAIIKALCPTESPEAIQKAVKAKPGNLTMKQVRLIAAAFHTHKGDAAGDHPDPIAATIQGLPAARRAKLVKLAVFPGTFASGAALGVAGVDRAGLGFFLRLGLLEQQRGRYCLNGSVVAQIQALPDWKSGGELEARKAFVSYMCVELRRHADYHTASFTSTALAWMDEERHNLDAFLEILSSPATLATVGLGMVPARAFSASFDLLEVRFPPGIILKPAQALYDFTVTAAGSADTPDAATIKSAVGQCLESMGDAEGALEAYRTALQIREKVLGADHATVAISHQLIGSVLQDMAKTDDALFHHNRALEIRRNALGEEALDTGVSYNNVASCLQELQKYEDALKAYERDLAIAVKHQGESPDTAISLTSIGQCLQALGRHEEALEKHRMALAIREQTVGPDSVETAASFNNIGHCYECLKKPDEALEAFMKDLAISIGAVGESAPEVAVSETSIASLLSSLGRFEEAIDHYQKALKIRAAEGESIDLAANHINIGRCLEGLGRHEDALMAYRASLSIHESVLGKDDPAVAIDYHSIGTILQEQGTVEEALTAFQRSLAIRVDKLGPDHLDTGVSYNNVASCLLELERHEEALEAFKKDLAISEKHQGEHEDVADAHYNVGLCLKGLGKLSDSLTAFKRALELRIQILGEDHEDTASAYATVGDIYWGLKRLAEAKEHHKKALDIRRRVLGDEAHPDVEESVMIIEELEEALAKPKFETPQPDEQPLDALAEGEEGEAEAVEAEAAPAKAGAAEEATEPVAGESAPEAAAAKESF